MTADYVPSVTEDNVLAAMRAFLTLIMPSGTEIIIGQENLVPEPTGDNFIMMVPLNRSRLAYNIDSWPTSGSYPTQATSLAKTKFALQLDFHGVGSSDMMQTFGTLFMDEYACDFFSGTPYDIAPLFSTDPIQAPFINGEKQYEDRWTMNALFELNAVVATPQQFATTLTPTVIEVDAAYPPGG
jgi:hypothetical protein